MSETTPTTQIPEIEILGRAMNSVRNGVVIIVHEPGSMIDVFASVDLRFTFGEPVLVIEPTRYRAIRAAGIIGSPMANCAIGDQQNEENMKSAETDETAITFTTYGYTLSTKSLMDANSIVLNGAQDLSFTSGLCKSLIKERLRHDTKPPRVIMLASTIDFDERRELEYWGAFDPEIIRLDRLDQVVADKQQERIFKDCSITDATMGLIKDGKSGILVYVASQREAAATAQSITEQLNTIGASDHVEVTTLFGRVHQDECLRAIQPPKPDGVKVLIGTSGLDTIGGLEWVDAAVSSGRLKAHMALRHDAVALKEMTIPVSQLETQCKVAGFCNDTTFILCSSNDEAEFLKPEFQRLPFTYLLLQYYNYEFAHGLTDLNSNVLLNLCDEHNEALTNVAYERKKLVQLGFIDPNTNMLTDEGVLARSMPVSPETAALLCHAGKLNILPQAIILAATFEIGGIRNEINTGHNASVTSDIFDAATAFEACYRLLGNEAMKTAIESLNVSRKQFYKVQETVWMMERTFGVKSDVDVFCSHESRQRILPLFRQCLLAASLQSLGVGFYNSNGQQQIMMLGMGQFQSDVRTCVKFPANQMPVAAQIKWVTPKNPNHRPFQVVHNITVLNWDAFVGFNAVRPGVISFRNTLGREFIDVFGVEFISRPSKVGLELTSGNLGTVLQNLINRKKAEPKVDTSATPEELEEDETASYEAADDSQKGDKEVSAQDMVLFCKAADQLTEGNVYVKDNLIINDDDKFNSDAGRRMLASKEEIAQLAARFNTSR